ncbi:hypothetical protein EJ04DRAFT_529417 [Polyplosphaeria fusca]|uniref:Uncharacterized protein n=1 Tax=Polyplosphaeria fusca TaxID=682080 RepID=A0A9P4QJI5_9PLEO|nr:hypothetical protein EJ04DRAFT_529417 [Polyplosphaeria fusca]
MAPRLKLKLKLKTPPDNGFAPNKIRKTSPRAAPVKNSPKARASTASLSPTPDLDLPRWTAINDPRSSTDGEDGDSVMEDDDVSQANIQSPVDNLSSNADDDSNMSEAGESRSKVIAGVQKRKQAAPPEFSGAKQTSNEPAANNEAAESPVSEKPKLAQLFTPYEPHLFAPALDKFMGVIAVVGETNAFDAHTQQSARSCLGQTNPPLWEDRGSRFEFGQFQPTLHPWSAPNADGSQADQVLKLVIKLIDRRKPNEPKPVLFYPKTGIPKDWHNPVSNKALNDRRFQAIERICADLRWTQTERDFLAGLFQNTPDASILDITRQFNYEFKGVPWGPDGPVRTMFDIYELHPGRTIESVRFEYIRFKDEYDNGIAPTDPRVEASKGWFGKKAAALEEEWMKKYAQPEDEAVDVKTKGVKKATKATKTKAATSGALKPKKDAVNVLNKKEDSKAKVSKAPKKSTPKKSAPKKAVARKQAAIQKEMEAQEEDTAPKKSLKVILKVPSLGTLFPTTAAPATAAQEPVPPKTGRPSKIVALKVPSLKAAISTTSAASPQMKGTLAPGRRIYAGRMRTEAKNHSAQWYGEYYHGRKSERITTDDTNKRKREDDDDGSDSDNGQQRKIKTPKRTHEKSATMEHGSPMEPLSEDALNEELLAIAGWTYQEVSSQSSSSAASSPEPEAASEDESEEDEMF